MSRFSSEGKQTKNYTEAVKYLKNVLDKEGLDQANRASSEVLSEGIKEIITSQGYRQYHTGCIDQLIHSGPKYDESITPPFQEHVRLFKKKEERIYEMHLYDSLDFKQIKELTEFCDKYNLKFSIKSASWHFPNRTVCVWIERADSTAPDPFVKSGSI
jgi:hypothetical protein